MNRTETNKIKQVLSYARATLQVDPDHKLVLLEFIPVEERLPEDSRRMVSRWVIAQLGPRHWVAAYRFKDKWWYACGPKNLAMERLPTHWAEIPEIAKEGE